ncbi:MAG: alkaline phosphatase family protein [Promethearchaeota archaeon]
MNKLNRFIYCIIDDVKSSHFFEFIKRGLLPNLRDLMANGIYSEVCVTDFPSVTYPTQVSQITGTYTGDFRYELCHGVPSYNWMDRNFSPPLIRDYGSNHLEIYKMNEDIGKNCQTILEMIGDGNKTSITQFINRGTNYMLPESKLQLIFYYLILKNSRNLKKNMARANTMVIHRLLENFQNPRKFFGNSEPPIGSLIWFMSSDVLMHWFGYDSYLYKLNLMHIDKAIGLLIKGLQKLGLYDETVIAITADHGNYKANKVGDISKFYLDNELYNYFFRNYRKGIRVKKKNLNGNVNIAEFGGVGLFYFRGKNKIGKKYEWTFPTIKEMEKYGPKKINLFEVLFKIEGSCLMYFHDNNDNFRQGTIYLRRKNQKTGQIYSGTIEYRGTGENFKTKYIMDNEEYDIFGYLDDTKSSKLLDNKFHSLNEWLDATYCLDYPMYPDLIARHFKNPRSSDIIVSTNGNVIYNIGHGQKKNDNIYSHDIGLKSSSIVPLIISGSPEIPKKKITYCKTTDIVPTLLKMLGKKPHKSVIGKSLI